MTTDIALRSLALLVIAFLLLYSHRMPIRLTAVCIVAIVVMFAVGLVLMVRRRTDEAEAVCAVAHLHALTGSYNSLCYDAYGRVYALHP